MINTKAGVKNENRTELTIVMPALNASATLSGTIARLHGAPVIVVDGGSTDGTPGRAARLGARVMAAPPGRGGQIAAGVAATRSPWLLLLHADTRLESGWREAAEHHMRDHPDKAGYFRFRLDSPDPRARRVERLVAWRCRILGLPYGDQGLLVARSLLDAVGGVRPLPLMEDVDLVRRLRGRLRPLACDAVTSASRWERDGWTRRSLRNLACLALWRAGVPLSTIVRLYR